MIDFMLTKTGDIVMSESNRKTSYKKMFFNVNNGSSIRLSFYIDDDPKKILKDKIEISFNIKNTDRGDITAMPIHNEKALKQMIYNAIYTSKNELKINKTFGSRMEEVKHHPIFDQNTISKAHKFLSEALASIIPNSEISVEPDYETKPKFKQGLRIKIRNKGELLFNEII